MRLKTQQPNKTPRPARTIKLKPDTWTHAHTQRLFHVSFLLAIMVIIAAFVLNLVFVFAPSLAAVVTTDPQTVSLTAYVSGVTSGPTTPEPPTSISSGGGGGSPSSPSNNPPTLPSNPAKPAQPLPAATLSITPFTGQATTTEQVSHGTTTATVPVFTTNRPRFVGYTNIPYANVTITLIAGGLPITGTSTADANGTFVWESAPLTSSGIYTVQMHVTNPADATQQATSSLEFAATFKAANASGSNANPATQFLPSAFTGSTLLDVYTAVVTNDKHILAGQPIHLTLQVVDLSGSHMRISVPLEFIVESSDGAVVLQSSETLEVQGTQDFTKIFYTALNTPPGQYLVLVEVPSQKTYAVGSDTFIIDPPPVVVAPTASNPSYSGSSVPLLTAQASVGLVIFFLFVAYFEFRTIRLLSRSIHVVSDRDLKNDIL